MQEAGFAILVLEPTQILLTPLYFSGINPGTWAHLRVPREGQPRREAGERKTTGLSYRR